MTAATLLSSTQPGQAHAIAGRPGTGKTRTMVGIVNTAVGRRLPAVYVTLEASPSVLHERRGLRSDAAVVDAAGFTDYEVSEAIGRVAPAGGVVVIDYAELLADTRMSTAADRFRGMGRRHTCAIFVGIMSPRPGSSRQLPRQVFDHWTNLDASDPPPAPRGRDR